MLQEVLLTTANSKVSFTFSTSLIDSDKKILEEK